MDFFDRLRRLLGSGESPSAPPAGGESPSDSCKPMSCMEALERVHEYLDGELDAVSHDEVARHFEMCQRCYPHLRLEERFREVLSRPRNDENCPEQVRERILELLAAESREKV